LRICGGGGGFDIGFSKCFFMMLSVVGLFHNLACCR
jgi:hypothetical protein